jgi:hypothetical protein
MPHVLRLETTVFVNAFFHRDPEVAHGDINASDLTPYVPLMHIHVPVV